jgi:cysteine desulfurase
LSSAEIYLDWNATTPPLPAVLQAMHETARTAWSNPASVHAAGRRARAVVEGCREAVASLMAVHPRDVLFTSGGTEANNLALRSSSALLLSRLEHPSVTRVAEELARQGVPVRWLDASPDGRVRLDAIAAALGELPRGATLALMAANHETGVIQPIVEAAELVRGAGARLHVDAVQAVGKLSPLAWALADSMSLGAHKFRGPKGIGALVWRPPWSPKPLLLGGAQERGLRPGTLDPVLAAGLHVACEYAELGPPRWQLAAALRDRLEAALARFSVVNGSAPRLPHVANLSFAGWRGDELVAALDLVGVCVASGSACSAGTTEPSKVIEAMLGRERAASAVRVSLGDETTPDQVDAAIERWIRVLARRSCSTSSAT